MHLGVDWTGVLGRASRTASRVHSNHSGAGEERDLILRGWVGRAFWITASIAVAIWVHPLLAVVVLFCTMRKIAEN
jgi:hypothetical protein